MVNQRFDARFHIKGLQHVFPDKICEITYGFHGDGLVKKGQGLFVFNAEPSPERGPVFGEGFENLDFGHFFQAFFELPDIRAKIAEML